MTPLTKRPNTKQLLSVPVRLSGTARYDGIYLVPTRKRHPSGYSLIAIIGVVVDKNGERAETCAVCDDVQWRLPDMVKCEMRTEAKAAGYVRMWWHGQFIVGPAMSSTAVTLVTKEATF